MSTFLFLALFGNIEAFLDTCNGQQSTTASPPGTEPTIPDLPQSFKTNLEINIMDKNMTVDVVEYFDYLGNRVRMDTMRNGYPGTALFDYTNDEAIYVSLGVCQVFNLTSRAEILAIFGQQMDNGLPHVMDSNYVLKFGSKYGESYMGSDVIRGINVEHWQACVYWSQFNRSYTVDYYFSAPGEWSTSSGFVSVPVRAEARGNGIHHIYDYYSFITGVGGDPDTLFETPAGVICKGRKNTHSLPRLAQQFYYRQEIIYPVPGLVTTTDVWYDEQAKLVRVDYRPIAPGEPTFTTNYLTEIHDFNTGVRYIKDNVLGNCTIYPLLNTSFGATENIAALQNNGSYMLHIKNPLQFFYLNSNFTYVGKDEFDNYPNDGDSGTRQSPVMMSVDIPGIGFHQVSNIMDFDSNRPRHSVFDVAACYQESEKLEFKIRFEGKFQPVLTDAFEYQAVLKLQEVTGVTPIRIQNLRLDYDLADLYLHATLLRDTPSTVQFTYVKKMIIEHQDDAVIGNVVLPVQCAQLCTSYTGFVCNSFDFCQGDSAGSCRLSKAHIGDGKSKIIPNSFCDHFSRNVDGSGQLTITNAYAALQRSVYANNFSVTVYIDNNPVWYDSSYRLTRYDYRSTKSEAPYYSTNPMTVIHDFNTGIQYVIDKLYQNCTISPIHPGSYDSELDAQAMVQNKAYILLMKNPLEYFHVSKNVRFIGQRNVRGMECNVYESVVQQYTMPGFPGTYTAVLQFFFLINSWSGSGINSGMSSKDQPVKLDIIIVEKSLYLTYNLYDFEAADPDLSLFDTKVCFSYKDQHHFQITFPGPFHPFLDELSKVFTIEAQEMMSAVSGATILRFTETAVNYDSDNVYLTCTLLEKPAALFDFTKIPGKVTPHDTDATYVTLSSPTECAEACLGQTQFACNSFDYCPSTQNCHLSKLHIQDGDKLFNQTDCDHYSRTVNGSALPSPSLAKAYTNLKNAIYLGKLQVKLPTQNNTSQAKFSSGAVPSGNGLAIDDCAAACLTEELFPCQAFDYCYNDGSCYLSGTHPDSNGTFTQNQTYCFVFGRQYLDSYTAIPGSTMPNTGNMISVMSIISPNLCAQQCSTVSLCRSFDYCDKDQVCYLQSTHILDSVNVTSSMEKAPTCTHYSRNYLNDFRHVANKHFHYGVSILYYGVSVDQCAKLCAELESVSCQTFTYCKSVQQCMLRTENPKNAPAGTIGHNDVCDLYISKSVWLFDFLLNLTRDMKS
ncbi:hypothetical protein FSP39_012798 [Pinctada imbricata]|uniref:Apple domain-containing protein n=1 Tax=Pinctada imbricata TaxID=66713 RepID=A0AA88XRP9_PINIB|nr:hypothetical protein FSP39_012798 [Pinctada imbricata]